MQIKSGLIVAAGLCAVLGGCGGGGESTTGGTAPGDSSVNVFAALVGTYDSGCVIRNASVSSPGQSVQVTATMTTLIGADKATVTLRRRSFDTEKCDPVTLNEDLTVGGQITDKTETKTVAGGVLNPKTGIAKTVEFRLDSLTLSKGSLTGSLPTFGTTAKVGYLIEGNKIHAVSGKREADGLGTYFSTTVLVRQ